MDILYLTLSAATVGALVIAYLHFRGIVRHWSAYVALAVWGASGFMASPTIASGVYHLVVIPPLLALLVALAHWEGARKAKSHGV